MHVSFVHGESLTSGKLPRYIQDRLEFLFYYQTKTQEYLLKSYRTFLILCEYVTYTLVYSEYTVNALLSHPGGLFI